MAGVKRSHSFLIFAEYCLHVGFLRHVDIAVFEHQHRFWTKLAIRSRQKRFIFRPRIAVFSYLKFVKRGSSRSAGAREDIQLELGVAGVEPPNSRHNVVADGLMSKVDTALAQQLPLSSGNRVQG